MIQIGGYREFSHSPHNIQTATVFKTLKGYLSSPDQLALDIRLMLIEDANVGESKKSHFKHSQSTVGLNIPLESYSDSHVLWITATVSGDCESTTRSSS